MLILRPYQRTALDRLNAYLQTFDDNPCIVIPTGGGKTAIIAHLCYEAAVIRGQRVVVLAHNKELLEQSAEKVQQVCPELPCGIYSAGLKRRDMQQPVIIAGIQSVYEKAFDFDPFDLIIVDEAHMIPTEGEGMYRRFLEDARIANPPVRVIGMTATPFRLKDGMICHPDHILNEICYEISVRELIQQGFLSPLFTRAAGETLDTSKLHVRGGEFISGELEALMDDAVRVSSACAEIVAQTRERQSVLIFATGVQHGQHIVEALRDQHGVECGFVTGETPAGERENVVTRFREGQLKYLCNVNVLTTGFDAPRIDCVVLLRPTLSPGLYYQMVGRGFRLHAGKSDCLILDFGGNVLRHGPVDALTLPHQSQGSENVTVTSPIKECAKCRAIVAAGYAACPECGHLFPERQITPHDTRASDAGILSNQIKDKVYDVLDIRWAVHVKRNAAPDAPRSMRVDYRVGLDHWVSEWVCVEHDGFARQMAERWWRQHSPDPVPDTAERAVELAEAGALAIAERIVVRPIPGKNFPKIAQHILGEKPAPVPHDLDWLDNEEVPF
ncbi:MAG: DNA helicase [Planctomyces sp.]|nr:DNA helicase [Planctomyces sp.]